MPSREGLTRAETVDLAPATDARVWTPVVDHQGKEERPRLIELISLVAQPFEVELRWSGGSASGAKAWLTVANATRAGLYARGVTVLASNLSNEQNRVMASITDGHCPTVNVYELRCSIDGETETTQSIPPYARYVWLDAGTEETLSLLWLRLVDGRGSVRAAIRGDRQAAGGTAVGGSSSIVISGPKGVPLRLVFSLAI